MEATPQSQTLWLSTVAVDRGIVGVPSRPSGWARRDDTEITSVSYPIRLTKIGPTSDDPRTEIGLAFFFHFPLPAVDNLSYWELLRRS